MWIVQRSFVFALGLAMIPLTAHGQCIVFPNPEGGFARADAVFVGTVVAHQPTGARGEHVTVDIATIRLERSWKGSRGHREVHVGSDRPWQVGKKYVVFAFGPSESLTTSIDCRWAESIETAAEKLDWLSVIPSQRDDL